MAMLLHVQSLLLPRPPAQMAEIPRTGLQPHCPRRSAAGKDLPDGAETTAGEEDSDIPSPTWRCDARPLSIPELAFDEGETRRAAGGCLHGRIGQIDSVPFRRGLPLPRSRQAC